MTKYIIPVYSTSIPNGNGLFQQDNVPLNVTIQNLYRNGLRNMAKNLDFYFKSPWGSGDTWDVLDNRAICNLLLLKCLMYDSILGA